MTLSILLLLVVLAVALEPACLMVYGPGRYRFADFLRVGGLLTVLVYVVAIVLTPVLWPL